MWLGKCTTCGKRAAKIFRGGNRYCLKHATADKEEAALQNKTNDGGRNGGL